MSNGLSLLFPKRDTQFGALNYSHHKYIYGEIGTMLLGTYYSASHKIEGKMENFRS